MAPPPPPPLILFFLLLSFSHFGDSLKTHIIRVNPLLMPKLWYEATLETLRDENTDTTTDHPKATKSTIIIHEYKTVFHGFSTQLTRTQAAKLSKLPGVITVIPDRVRKLLTTRSPSFLGLYSAGNINNNDYKVPGYLLNRSNSASNVIIGILDTGIHPEHVSFRGEGLGPVPSKWKGECEEGQNFKKSDCNKKLIGARFFSQGYEAEFGKLNSSEEEFISPRDSDGHGTHTASVAAGRAVGNAPLFDDGHVSTAVGVAPNARIAAYKVFWQEGAMDSDILAAIEKAVEDGVDILSYSIDGDMSNLDLIAIGAFGAMERGVFFSTGAGNSGPEESSVGNVAPWMTTVGASTIDRRFPAELVLGDGRVLKGSSIYTGQLPLSNNLSIIYASECTDIKYLKSIDVCGKIVVCDTSHVYDPISAVMSAGAAAMVVFDKGLNGEDLIAYLPHWMPAISIPTYTSFAISNHIQHSNPNARATMSFHGMKSGIKPAPLVAAFSSRGPTTVAPFVMKPDLIAPGVNILGAYPFDVSGKGKSVNPRQSAFYVLSGTSTSCPHVSGVAALLKGAHPEWTPAMIRSAMMTTAYTTDKQGQQILDGNDYKNANVWAMGAGHVDPEKAVDPGLVYNISPGDYFDFLCASGYSVEGIRTITTSRNINTCCPRKNQSSDQPWNLNYPAITVDFKTYRNVEIVVKRTVTHVGDTPSNYTVKVVNPKGVNVIVTPDQMKFKGKNEKQTYCVSIKAKKLTVPLGESTTDVGKLVWSDGKRNVVSPVVIMWQLGYY